jgi:hypothetical protein
MDSNHNLDGPFLFEIHSWIFGVFHTLHRILCSDTLFYTINFVLTHIFLILNHKPSPLMESHPFSKYAKQLYNLPPFFLKYLLTPVLIKTYYLLFFFSLINIALNKVSFYDAAAIFLALKACIAEFIFLKIDSGEIPA